MAVIIEPKRLVIGNVDLEGFKILQRESWIPFLHKFSGYNLEVIRQFAESFYGQKTQRRNLTLYLSEDFISQVTRLPQIGGK